MFTIGGRLFILCEVCRGLRNDRSEESKRQKDFTEDQSINEIEIFDGSEARFQYMRFGAPRERKARAFHKRDSCVKDNLFRWKQLPISSYKTKTHAMLTLELRP